MGFLTAIVEAAAAFVRRNPLTVLCVVVLAVAAPSLLRGVALFILYAMLSIVLLVLVLVLLFRWRLGRVQREMQEQFGREFRRDGFGGPRPQNGREGDVKIYATSDKPEKRVSSDVGDYVEFEETKENR